MKNKNKILAIILAVAVSICMMGLPVSAATKATTITFTKTTNAKVRVGYAFTRTAVTTPEGIAVKYASSDATIATVNENGRVVGKKPGKTVITASAGGLKTSYNVTVVKADAATKTKVFDGYKITVLDKKTPAVNVRGRANDRNVMCFVSASDEEVGVISYSDYTAIIAKNKKVIKQDGGGTLNSPPDGWSNWHDWFADEFNKFRGLTAESREKAVASNTEETIEKYRQEVIRLVNEEREKAGLSALYADEKAMEYAQTRAQEISVSYSHTRPNGLKKPFDEIGVMNENIAGGGTPADVMRAWMNSPGHRGNILNKDAFAIGVGCYWTGASFYWVQEFLW